MEDGSGTVPSVRAGFIPEIKVDDGEDRVIEFAISTDSIDRDFDRIKQDGWVLDKYRKNPVVLFGHHYWNNEAPVVGKSLTEWVEKHKLKSRMQFTPEGTVPLADMLYRLYAHKFMRATSVGFIPLEWKFVQEDDRPFGVDFEKQELLEYSLVPVPANADALSEARSKGISTQPLKLWSEDVLDAWRSNKKRNLWIPKSVLEDIRRMADSTQSVVEQVVSDFTSAIAQREDDEFMRGESPESVELEFELEDNEILTDEIRAELDHDKELEELLISAGLDHEEVSVMLDSLELMNYEEILTEDEEDDEEVFEVLDDDSEADEDGEELIELELSDEERDEDGGLTSLAADLLGEVISEGIGAAVTKTTGEN
jgi:HK97 family phage prohead protease